MSRPASIHKPVFVSLTLASIAAWWGLQHAPGGAHHADERVEQRVLRERRRGRHRGKRRQF